MKTCLLQPVWVDNEILSLSKLRMDSHCVYLYWPFFLAPGLQQV
jgi:hypothetical protein